MLLASGGSCIAASAPLRDVCVSIAVPLVQSATQRWPAEVHHESFLKTPAAQASLSKAEHGHAANARPLRFGAGEHPIRS